MYSGNTSELRLLQVPKLLFLHEILCFFVTTMVLAHTSSAMKLCLGLM